MFLGEGANILFTKNFEGVVIKASLKGIKVKKETKDHIILEIGSGENWHSIVAKAVKNNWGGIENLALIPGTVEAAPSQNIDAYEQRQEDTVD